MNPWLIIGIIVLFIGSNIFSFFKGEEVKENEIKAVQLEATEKAITKSNEQVKVDDHLVKTQIVIQEKIKVEYKYIKEKADENINKNPVYAECGLDDDGLRLFNSSSSNRTTIP